LRHDPVLGAPLDVPCIEGGALYRNHRI
jgi:hypothetical protein